jgi:hypothetical protein
MAATFPNAIKVFTVFHDYTDIIWALSINECHDEIQALEKTLGANPFAGTPYISFSGAIQDLFLNKAPINHTHGHHDLLDDTVGNDHPQYIQINGYPGFSRPVTGKAGSAPADLVPLSQLQSFGYQNNAQVVAAVNAATSNLMAGARGGAPLLGASASTAWRITGGLFSGCTDGSGRVTVPFGITYGQVVQSFSATKLPPAPGGGCAPYNWIEAQMTLVGVAGNSATVQFSHDYSWQAGMWVTFTWIVMGI